VRRCKGVYGIGRRQDSNGWMVDRPKLERLQLSSLDWELHSHAKAGAVCACAALSSLPSRGACNVAMYMIGGVHEAARVQYCTI
jgi:hypothetical protein